MSATTTEVVGASGMHLEVRGDLTATGKVTYADIHYFAPPTASVILPLWELSKEGTDMRRLPIHDLRGQEDQFKLDECGFQVLKYKTKLSKDDFDSEAIVKDRYFPELEEIVARMYPNAKEVVHLGHMNRGAYPETDFAPKDPAWNKPDRKAAPRNTAHIDYSARGVEYVLQQVLEISRGQTTSEAAANAARVLKSGHRAVTLTIWRPLKRVLRDPLAFCDGRTVDVANDHFKLERVYQDGRMGENIVVKGPPAGSGRQHSWYWISEQEIDEVVVLKLHDSDAEKRDDVITGAPHSSIQLDGTGLEEVRESVEARVIVCF